MSERNIDHLLEEADNIMDEGQRRQENASFDIHTIEKSRENLVEQGKSSVLDHNGNTAIEANSPGTGRRLGKQDFHPLQDDDNSEEINYLDVEQKRKGLELVEEKSSVLNFEKMKTYNKFSALIPQLFDSSNIRRKSNRRQIDGDLDSNSEDSDIMSQAPETQGDLKFLNTSGQYVAMKTHPRLNNHRNLFKNLLKQTEIKLCDPVVSMVISQDSTKAISISKESDMMYCISQHDLESYEETFSEHLGGGENDYIKCKEIAQNKEGNLFAVPYNNDGVFKIRIFGKENRDEEEINKNDINVSQILGLPNMTMCNVQDYDPFINVVFITDNKLYVCLFQNLIRMHYHFFLSISDKMVVGKVVSQELKGSLKNFPSKSFYNQEQNEIYTIYRQSEAFIISEEDAQSYRFDDTIMEEPGVALGQMYLIFNKTLIVSCSSDILFFKIEHSVETDNREFQIYQSIRNVGQNSIYFIENNVRIQVVTADKIYFYKMNRETLEAELQYVMFNHMKCNQIMIGPQVKYAVTYKQNEQSFEIHRRRYIHGFKVPIITKQNYEGGICMDLPSEQCFMVALLDKINFFDSNTFQQRKELSLDIQLLKVDTREPNQIISMAKSINDEFIGVITGKILVMSEQKMNQLYVFRKRKRDEIEADMASEQSFDLDAADFYYERVSIIQLREVEIFREGGVCADFHFFEEKNKDVKHLLFCRKDIIFLLNFETQEMQKVFKFEVPMTLQPLQMEPNHDNMVIMVTSPKEGYLVDLRKPKNEQCYIFHKEFKIDSILSVVYEVAEQDFYIICNKYNENLGFFVLKVCQDHQKKCTFLIKWKNKLDIANCSMHILRYPERGYCELVIGFKQIYVNSYSLFCIDISVDDVEPILFRHDSYQLWETNCTGLLLNNKTSDFVTLNQDGMWITSFGAKNLDQDGNNESQNRQRMIQDDCGQERILHSIESCNFLKLEKENYIFLNCMNPDSQIISVCQEYQKVDKEQVGEDEMGQWVLYNVDLQHINLRELLLFQSLSTSKSMSDIFEFVQDQPNPQIFFKSAFELDFANLVSILSFDSRSISYLLDPEENEEYFRGSDYPLFYRNKMQKGASKNCKYFYRSAIDSALRSNQTQSVEHIIQYIVTYQNDFISSWLFRSNIPQLCSTGVKLHELFDSSVFKFSFEFDQWPQVHPNDREIMRPFNYNIFELRKHYKDIFPEKEFEPVDLMDEKLPKDKKMNKVKYTIILLPVIGTHYLTEKCPYTGKVTSEFLKDNIYTTGVLSESDQIEIFNCENMQHFIDFKWQTFGFLFHLVSTVFQLAYLTMLFIYVMNSYINYDPAAKIGTDIFLILIFVAYPLVLETMQACKIGPINYITDPDNWLDIIFIYGSAAMAIVHYINGPQHIASKILIVIVLFSAFRQTLKLLRIFSALSSLVAMLTSVIWKLKTFMTFFIIILVFFAEILAVLGVGNIKRPDGYRLVFYDDEKSGKISDDAPNVDQRQINLLLGNIIHMFRISMGDFALIDLVKYMNNREDVIIFWIIWFIMVLVLAVVFLNFVVAEASETYNIVNDSIIETIYQQKADLIHDAESIMPNAVKSTRHFPKYIVRRQIET